MRVTGYARSLPPLRVAAGKTVVLGAVAVAGFAAAATSVALQGGQVRGPCWAVAAGGVPRLL